LVIKHDRTEEDTMAFTALFKGLRVVDFTQVLSGPFATMLLADAGADVVKIEKPQTGDPTRQWGPPFVYGESLYFAAFNRGKRSVAWDLHDPKDRCSVKKLLGSADVLVENFRPGWMAQWGLDADTLLAENPRLIYCSIKGYRADSHNANRPGVEVLLEAESGLMAITGSEAGDDPVRLGIAAIDMMTGAFAVAQIASMLYRREKTGKGGAITVSLEETADLMMTHPWLLYLRAGAIYPRSGSAHASIAPYEAFRTQDRPIILGAIDDTAFQRLAETLGEPQWVDRDEWRTNEDRVLHRSALKTAIEAKLSQHPAAHWHALFVSRGLPVALVNSVDQAAKAWSNSPIPKLSAYHRLLGQLTWPTSPWLSDGGTVLPPPELGEHTQQFPAAWQNTIEGSNN
jgi:crotonobetainyl-CoA:carnitine CoA-transferase CaiB-like acyl-CoA transferase